MQVRIDDAPPRSLSRVAELLGQHGFSVIRTDDLEVLRVRAQVGDTHGGFRSDALATMRDVRAITTRGSAITMYAALDEAHKIAAEFVRRHAPGA